MLTSFLSNSRKALPGDVCALKPEVLPLEVCSNDGYTVSDSITEGALIYTKEGEEIGVVTSGTFSPSLNHPIAMGYVKTPFSKADTRLVVKVRGKDQECKIVKGPFVPHG